MTATHTLLPADESISLTECTEYSEQVKSLAEALQTAYVDYRRHHSAGRCVLILDPALRDLATHPDFAACLAQKKLSPAALPRLVWQPHYNLQSAHQPYLIELDLDVYADAEILSCSLDFAHVDWQADSVVQGRGHRVCGWVFTDQSTVELASQWGRRLIQTDGFHRRFLRFYDPAVLPRLWPLLSLAQQHCLLQPAQQWFMLDADGSTLHCYALPPLPDEASPSVTADLALTNAQWQAVQTFAIVNQLVTQWPIEHHGQQLNAGQQKLLQDALVRAIRYGLRDSADLKAFGRHALTVHPRFDNHPRIQALLQQVTPQLFYAGLASELTESDWQVIAHACTLVDTRTYTSPTTLPISPGR